MNTGVISVRYARALLKCATDAAQEQKVCDEMTAVAKAYIELPALRVTIDNPMLPKERKEALLLAAVGSEPTELTVTFVRLVLKEGRENMMQFIANAYVTLYRMQKNIIRGKLTTATPVTEAVERKMRSVVETTTNATLDFETETDPDIIGGFILEYDTYRMDASVKTRLNCILKEIG